MAAAGTNAGNAAIKVNSPSLESAEIEIDGKEAYVKAGISANTSNYHVDTDENEIPIRKIEIASTEGMILDKEHPETVLTAKCYPSCSTYDELEWSVLNDAGEHGSQTRQMIEFTHTDDAEEKTFDINPIKGKNKVTFVFLPGSNFDFEWFRFE